jgi:hypothetical protein
MLAPADCCPEDVPIFAIIITELELRNVQRQIFLLTLWNVPTTPRLTIDRKPSIVFV